MTLGEQQMTGGPSPRLVVDLSDLQPDRATMDAAYAGVREHLFGTDGLFPLALVITEAQYDLLPRSFDDLKDRLRIERVATEDAGRETVERIAGHDTPVAAARTLVELARWWAMSVEGGKLVFEPVDGLIRLRSEGRLPTPAVPHPLEAGRLGVTQGAVRGTSTLSGVRRRRLIDALAREDAAKEPPQLRFDQASQLGVLATSTAAERTKEAIDALSARLLPLTVGVATPAQWDALLARAARRPVDATAVRVGDIVHVLNPTGELTPDPRMEIHRVACAEPAITRLRAALATWTEDDYLEDPLLGALVYRLAGEDEQQRQLLFHARAAIVLGGELRPAEPELAPKPLVALRRLLAGDPPEALLRVSVEGSPAAYGAVGRVVNLKPFVYPGARFSYTAVKGVPLLSQVPPTGDVLWPRSEYLHGVIPAGSGDRAPGPRFEHPWRGLPPVILAPGAGADDWLDDVEASPWLGAEREAAFRRWNAAVHLASPNTTWTSAIVPRPGELWEDADTELALAWWSLQEALRAPRSIRLPDGAILLQVGGGLAARIAIRAHGAAKAPVRGALRCTVTMTGGGWNNPVVWDLDALTQPVTTHLAHSREGSTRLGVLLPELWVAGRGWAADVRFLPAPLLGGGGPALGAALGRAKPKPDNDDD